MFKLSISVIVPTFNVIKCVTAYIARDRCIYFNYVSISIMTSVHVLQKCLLAKT